MQRIYRSWTPFLMRIALVLLALMSNVDLVIAEVLPVLYDIPFSRTKQSTSALGDLLRVLV